jgi:ABC-type uncharacterized transport system ATPase subunit
MIIVRKSKVRIKNNFEPAYYLSFSLSRTQVNKKKPRQQLTIEQKKFNHQLASERIVIENIHFLPQDMREFCQADIEIEENDIEFKDCDRAKI